MAAKGLVYVYQQVRLPGEKLQDVKAQADALNDADKATLKAWADEEQAA